MCYREYEPNPFLFFLIIYLFVYLSGQTTLRFRLVSLILLTFCQFLFWDVTSELFFSHLLSPPSHICASFHFFLILILIYSTSTVIRTSHCPPSLFSFYHSGYLPLSAARMSLLWPSCQLPAPPVHTQTHTSVCMPMTVWRSRPVNPKHKGRLEARNDRKKVEWTEKDR